MQFSLAQRLAGASPGRSFRLGSGLCCGVVLAVLVAPLPAKGTPIFGARRAYPVGTSPIAIAVGQFDAQAGLDLATADEGGTISWLGNRGDGVFTPAGRLDVEERYGVTALVGARLNADALDDLAIVANDSDSPNFTGAVVLFRSSSVGTYATSAVGVGLFPTCVVSADLTGDGIADLATCSSNPSGGGLVSILRGRADFSFTPPVSVPLTAIVPQRLAVADLDRDGRPDIVVVDSNGNAVWLLYGAEEPQFDAPIRLGVVNDPSAATILPGDANTLPFVVVASAAENAVRVYRQASPRSFSSPLSVAAGESPADLVAADIDGDSLLDLLVANAGADSVTVLKGSAGAGFALLETVPVGSRPVALAVADFNADGRPDFATVDQNDTTFGADVQSVSVVLNGVSPPFTPTPTATPLLRSPTATPSTTIGTTATPTPTRSAATATPRRTPTAAGEYDANCDGYVDQADLAALMASIFDEPGCLNRAVSAADITALSRTLSATP